VWNSSATTLSLYINGVLTAANTSALTPDSGSGYPLTIGNFLGTYFMNGIVDEVRVYSRALSASDVLTLYNSTATACASPVGYAGDLIYNAGTYHVPQYCDGLNWQPIGPVSVPGAGGAGCSSPSGSEGDMVYNSDKHTLQYCDGTNWISAGGTSTATTNGLVGWWNLDEGSGTSAADSSGNGNTGTTQNTPTWTASGEINGALTLNGTNQDVAATETPSLILAGSWTASAWVKVAALPTSGNNVLLVSKSTNGGGNAPNYSIGIDNTGGVIRWQTWFMDTGSGNNGIYYTATINLNTWYFVTGVWDNTAKNLYLYVNGTQVGSTLNVPGVSPLTTGGNTLDIGDHHGFAGSYLNGTIDDVRVYNRALSAAEVWSLYNGGP
jgi:hypothetical protein